MTTAVAHCETRLGAPPSRQPRGTAVRAPLFRFLAATTISCYGDWLTTVALIVVLYRATGSIAGPAAYMLVRVAPRAFGSGPGGVLADRVRPTRAAALVALTQALLILAIMVSARAQVYWLVYVLILATQFLGAASRPITLAIMARLVPPARRGRANQLYSTLFASSVFVAPALGAVILPLSGASILLVADAASFVVAAILLLTLGSDSTAQVTTVRLRTLLTAGLGQVFHDRTLRVLAAGYFASGAAVTALQAVLVVASEQRLGQADRVGWFYAAVGAGGLLGAALGLWNPLRSMPRAIILAGIAAEVVMVAAFAILPVGFLGLPLLAASSLGGTIYGIRGNLLIQGGDPELVGRISGAIATLNYLGMMSGALAALLLSGVVDWVPLVIGVSLGGLALVAASMLVPESVPRALPAESA